MRLPHSQVVVFAAPSEEAVRKPVYIRVLLARERVYATEIDLVIAFSTVKQKKYWQKNFTFFN